MITEQPTTTTDHALVEAGIRAGIALHQALLEPERIAAVVRAADTVTASIATGGKLLVFGNGGSAADAQHIAAEFLGRYLIERPSLPAIALSDNGSAVTAIGNDYGFGDVFARQVKGLGRPGDVALGITTSGSSANVLEGVRAARAQGMHTIGMTGCRGELSALVDVCVEVPSESTPRIQEAHMLMAHLLCEMVERRLAADA